MTDAEPDRFFASLGDVPGTVVMVVGMLGVQAACETGDAAAEVVMQTNYNGPARVLLAAARLMEPLGGCIIGISSVAGDRGRKSNYIYGSAKAGLTAFLSGLRNRLYGKVHVMTVKPGFVATRMTAGMALPPRLTAQPGEVAAAIFKAQAKGRDTVYVRPVWRVIMLVIRSIPRAHLQAALALSDGIASVLMRGWTLDAAGVASLMAAFIIGGLVPVPRTPMNIASGMVFGLFAVPVIAVASTVGGVIAFVSARHMLQHRVHRVLTRQRHAAAILRAVDLEGWRVVALLRFYGPVPTTVQNYLFGLTRIGLWSFTAATLVFSIPQIAFYCYL